jgi:hypothetical protein
LPFCRLRLTAPKAPRKGYPENTKSLGEHVKKRRMDLGFKQADVARRAGVDKMDSAQLRAWEDGTRRSLLSGDHQFSGVQPPAAAGRDLPGTIQGGPARARVVVEAAGCWTRSLGDDGAGLGNRPPSANDRVAAPACCVSRS